MMALRAVVLLISFVGFTLPLMPVQWLLLKLWPAAAARFSHTYHKRLARLLGFHVKITGVAPLQGPAFIVCNHVSWIDIVVLSSAMPVSFVAKREVASWPFFGRLAKLQNTAFIDREDRRAIAPSRDGLAQRLAAGEILILFPEGTSHDGLHVLPFRSSFFAAVEDQSIPVIPVTLAYTQLCGMNLSRRMRPHVAWYGDMQLAPHLWHMLKAGPLVAELIFHPPMFANSRKDRKQLAAISEAIIRRKLAETLHGRQT